MKSSEYLIGDGCMSGSIPMAMILMKIVPSVEPLIDLDSDDMWMFREHLITMRSERKIELVLLGEGMLI